MKASVIISVYRNTKSLKMVLDSLKEQTEKDFEIIITEDACGDGMRQFIESYDFANPHTHLTQDDSGWRKNLALNRAIVAAQADWIIMVDGDCILHPRFVEFHLRNASPDVVLGGKRVKLGEWSAADDFDPTCLRNINKTMVLETLHLKQRRGDSFCEEGIFIDPDSFPWGFIPRIRKMHELKGCNMSFSKEAIMKINGFDMDYTKPAVGEDIDLGWRFKAAGYKLKSLRNMAVQYHIWHKTNWTDQSENLAKLEAKKAQGNYVCLNGIAQISEEDK